MKVSFWLIPAEPDRAFYQSLINTLAHQYNAPMFQPHITIHSGACDLDKVLEFLQSIHQHQLEISLEVDRVRYSEQFTKTLFIQLCSNSELEQLSESIQRYFDATFELDPHLSLIYAPLTEMEKRSLTEQLQLSDRVIRFDRVCAIETPNKTQTREDVEAWREIDPL